MRSNTQAATAAIAAFLLLIGCAREHQQTTDSDAAATHPDTDWRTVNPSATPADHAATAEAPTIEHITRISPTLVSGSEPVSDADFALIRAMGVRTIISVDGATPDVERARRHGLKYVHIPIAYSALNASDEAQLERAAHELDGPIFVHCHHGLHRGPVAAAVIYAAQSDCSGADAARLLYDAGLPRKYKALHDSLESFMPGTRRLPDPAVVGPLPEIAQRDSLTLAMSDIDRSWERLLACRKSDWRTPADQPDVEPAHEAAIFAELFRESNRLHLADADDDMRTRMADAEKLAWALNAALESRDMAAAESVADKIVASCTDCHNRHRNN